MASIATSTRRAFSAGLLAVVVVGTAQASECRQPLYLTFDVGNMRHAEYIAKVLNEEKVRATFFLANNLTVRGDHALDDSWRGYWQARLKEGHVFGNHTWSHLYAHGGDKKYLFVRDRTGKRIQLDRPQFCGELKRVDARFTQLTGQHLSPIWRAPGGRTNTTNLRWAPTCGFPQHVGWADAGLVGDELPSEKFPNDLLVKRALERLRSGDVILMHLGIRSRRQPLAEALQPMIQGLKARGFCFATVPPGATDLH